MHRVIFFTIMAALLCLLPGHAAGAPPLTEPQQQMLAETGDTLSQPAEKSEQAEQAPPIPMPLEQPGLYALLNNAMAWEPGDERGARRCRITRPCTKHRRSTGAKCSSSRAS